MYKHAQISEQLGSWFKTKEKQEEQSSDDSHSSAKSEKVLVKSLKYTLVTQSILFLIFLLYVATIHQLLYSGQESKKQYAVYDSDIPVT